MAGSTDSQYLRKPVGMRDIEQEVFSFTGTYGAR